MYKNYTKKTGMPPGYIYKFLLIMRLTTVLLIATIMQVSASSFGQKITVHQNNATLDNVINEIRNKSGYDFIYKLGLLKKAKRVTINVENADLKDVLNYCFKDQPFTYELDNKVVILKEKAPSFLDDLVSVLQPDSTFMVTGHVIDADGNSIPGATINVTFKKSRVTASTNDDGTFKFLASKGDVLVLSYMGYVSKRIKLNQGNLGDIRLQTKVDSLQEIKIVIGYGTTTKILNTGNVSVVTSDDISKQPLTNVLLALQGRVAGMEVNQTNGFTSSPVNLKIRGQNSIGSQGNGGRNNISEPLYIIDGVPIISGAVAQQNVGINQNDFLGPTGGQSPLFGINPTDIESISVLKDADATAIYGARGANGVILITTKKGKAGKTVVNANVYTGLSLQTKKLDLMNTEQYLEMRKRAFVNDGFEPEDYNGYDLKYWDQNRYTDWQKEFLSTAHTSDAQLSLSGGDQNTTFRLSGGFNTSSPPFKGDYKEQRVSATLNVNNTSFNNKLVTTAMVNFSSTTSNLPSQDITSLIFIAPNAPSLFNEAGELNFEGWKDAGGLTYQAVNLKRPYDSGTVNLISNLTLKYHIIPGLDFNSSLGYNMTRQNQLSMSPADSFNPAYTIVRESRFGTNNSSSWIIEPSVTWNKSFGKHYIETLLGSTFQNTVIEGTTTDARGFSSDALLQNLGAASSYTAISNYIKTRFESIYARINYNYKGKYVINLNGRRDGSSRFASGKQFGDFGSVGAAWIFSEENLIKDKLPFLSLGKIRASYGLVGDDGLGDYQYLSSFNSGNNPYQDTPVLQLARLANDQFSWTTNKKAELAVSFGLFNGRINTELSWYRNVSGNQLVSTPLAATTGFSSVIANLPATIENKGLEFTLQTQNITAKNFQWSTNFNISKNSNKLLEFPDLANSTYSYTYAVGRSITSQGMRKYTGVDPVSGEYTFADIDGDGEVDNFGSKDYIYKNTNPSFFGGINNSLTYKDVQLSFFFSFVKQKGVLRLSNVYPGAVNSGMGNQLILSEQFSGKPVLESLTTTTYDNNIFNYYSSDAVWVDASFIRLQNLSLAYNLPSSLLRTARLQNLKIYMQAQNVFTITGYKGPDPSSPGSFSLPPRKIITAGIQLVF